MGYEKNVAMLFMDHDITRFAERPFKSIKIGLRTLNVYASHTDQEINKALDFGTRPGTDLVVIDNSYDTRSGITRKIKESGYKVPVMIFPVTGSSNLDLGQVVKRSRADFALRDCTSETLSKTIDAILNRKPIPSTLFYDPERYRAKDDVLVPLF